MTRRGVLALSAKEKQDNQLKVLKELLNPRCDERVLAGTFVSMIYAPYGRISDLAHKSPLLLT
tara:strand:+ start:74 stop:262 length:189 start_codon:yes stop_codon:yes gene_type:complete